MRTRFTPFGIIAMLVAAGCAGSSDPGGGTAGSVDGKADGFGFEFGIFTSDVQYELDEGRAPLTVAFHDYAEGLRDGYAGHFDMAMYDVEGYETEYFAGVFKLLAEGDETSIVFETYDGEVLARYPWSVVDGKLYLGEIEYWRARPSQREEVLGQCEAVHVIEYELEEGFTPYEYPAVYIERDAEGVLEVQLGCVSWDTTEAEIDLVTTETGGLEATVTTSYGNVFVVRIPNVEPLRGEVLYGDAGEEPQLMAHLACLPPVAEPVAEIITHFTCTTRRPDPNGETATIQFDVVDVDEPEIMDLHWPEDVELPISVAPETSYAHTLVGGIADGYLSYEDGKLRIFTDQIGYEFGELELYENSGFQHGYFRFEMMDPDNTSFYTEVDCSLD